MVLALFVVPQRRLKIEIQMQVVFLGSEGNGVKKKWGVGGEGKGR